MLLVNIIGLTMLLCLKSSVQMEKISSLVLRNVFGLGLHGIITELYFYFIVKRKTLFIYLLLKRQGR